MKEKIYKYGPWVYRYMCKSCGHTVTHPQHQQPCMRCGGDFGHKTSMRKVWLEPETTLPSEPEPEPPPKTPFQKLMTILGLEKVDHTPKNRPKVKEPKWRWQFHSEVEDDSGVIRHEDFFK
jgi:hypothetical protein